MRNTSLLFFIALLASAPTDTAWSDACLRYEPATTTLTGTIQRVHGYGPPNFGETPEKDSRTIYTLLTLDQPVCIAAGDEIDETKSGIRQLELVGADNTALKFDEGSRVTVAGKLTMSGVERGSPVDVLLIIK